jgi:hypothetical protein
VDFAAEQAKHKHAIRSYDKELRHWEERTTFSTGTTDMDSSSQVHALSQMSSARMGNCKDKIAMPQDSKPIPPVLPQPCMHADKVSLFLLLATALELYLGHQIDEDSIVRASKLFQDYLLLYCRVSKHFHLLRIF